MSHDQRHSIRKENIALFGGEQDAELTAVQVAIHLEEALGMTLPTHFLDAAHLGSRKSTERTLVQLIGPT
jgi:hypothetical protein